MKSKNLQGKSPRWIMIFLKSENLISIFTKFVMICNLVQYLVICLNFHTGHFVWLGSTAMLASSCLKKNNIFKFLVQHYIFLGQKNVILRTIQLSRGQKAIKAFVKLVLKVNFLKNRFQDIKDASSLNQWDRFCVFTNRKYLRAM